MDEISSAVVVHPATFRFRLAVQELRKVLQDPTPQQSQAIDTVTVLLHHLAANDTQFLMDTYLSTLETQTKRTEAIQQAIASHIATLRKDTGTAE
jgi:hypothetical protein